MKFDRSLLVLALAAVVLVSAGCKSAAQREAQYRASAQTFMDQQRYPEAIIQYRNAAQLAPRDAALQYQLGQAYSKNQQYQDAFLALTKAVALRPDYPEAQLALGEFYLVSKQFDKGVAQANAVLAKHPGTPEAEILLSNLSAAQGKMPDGISRLQTAIAADPNNVALHLSLGILFAAAHQNPQAQQEFEKAVSLDPKSVAARNDLASLYASQGQWDQAEKIYRQDVQDNPASSDALLQLANFLTGRRRFAEAEPVYQRWVGMEHNTPQAQFTLASFYALQGKDSQAETVDQRIARDFPTFTAAREQWAQLEERNKNYPEANRVVADLIKDHPNDMTALLLQATIHLDQHQPAQALTTLAAAQRLNPNLAQVSYEQGQAYVQQNDAQHAQDSFLNAVKLNANYYPALGALSELMLSQGHADTALVYAQKMQSLQPNQPQGFLDAGNAQASLQQLPQAEASFQRYAALAPNSSLGPNRLGNLYLVEKRNGDAEREFQQALKINPRDTDSLTGLVATEEQEGKAAAATSQVQAALAAAAAQHAPNSELAVMNDLLARTYAVQKRTDLVEPTLRLALSQDPNNFNTYVLLGTLYAQRKSFQQAQQEFAGAAKANPNSAGLWTLLGMLDEQVNQPQQAEQAYIKALAIDPTNGVANNNLASLYTNDPTKLDQALILAQRAKRVLPSVANVNDTLGWIYVNQSVYQLAIPLLQQAVDGQPNTTDFRVHLATALYRSGQKVAARAQLRAAIKLNQALAQQADIQQMLKN